MDNNLSKQEQLELLENRKGLQYLLNEIYKILGNPVATFDLNYNLIAYTDGVVTDDSLWNELISTGGFGDKAIGLFKSEDWIDAVANSEKIALMTSAELKYDRINVKIFNENMTRIANLIIVACNKSFEDDDPEFIVDICEILSNEFQEDKFYQDLDCTYQETLIYDLLSGNPVDRRLVTAKLEDIYRGMKENLYLAVIEVPPNLHNNLVHFRELFKQIQRNYKYYIYCDYIVILMSTNNAKFYVKRELRKLMELFTVSNMYAGISRRFEDLFELHKFYIEALNVLKKGVKMTDVQRVFLYDNESIMPLDD